MAKRKKKIDPIVVVTILVIVLGVAGLAYIGATGKGPSVTIRGKPASNACKRARKNFELCMKRSGPTGLKGCTSEFAHRETTCKSSR